MRFSREGIRARVKKDEDGDVVPNAFIVTVDQEVPVGIHNVRVGGPKLGASNCRSFVVSDLPQVAAGTDNRTREKAFEVKLGSTVFVKDRESPRAQFFFFSLGNKLCDNRVLS